MTAQLSHTIVWCSNQQNLPEVITRPYGGGE